MTDTAERTYRFAARDRNAWLLGLTGAQCLILAAGGVTAGLCLNARLPLPFALAVVIAAAVASFATIDDRPVHDAGATAAGWVIRRHRRRTRWAPALTVDRDTTASFPPQFGPVTLFADTTTGPPVGMVEDNRTGSLSATVRVAGHGFVLQDPREQERLLAGWGDALAGFCAERNPTTRLTVTEWAAPAGLDAHDRYLDAFDAAPVADAAAAYTELLAGAGPLATRHETLLTVTVDPPRARPRRRRSRDAGRAETAETLRDQLRLLAGRLDHAGLDTSPPLTITDLAATLRARLDPAELPTLTARARARNPGVSVANAGPMAVDATWTSVRVDGAYHASFWVAEWPRLEVGPAWLEPLLLHAGGVRTVTLLLEPVPARVSHRGVERDAIRVAADEEQRRRGGWRIGAKHRRAADAVAAREAELVGGYAEFGFAALLTVTAPDPDTLERSCTDFEQTAAQTGIELRRLDGRHDLALPLALPLGRPLARTRLT